MRVAVSGLAQPYSGVGVLQRELYPRLQAMGFELIVLPGRDVSSASARYMSLFTAALRPLPKNIDHFLAITTPFPLRVSAPATTVVHDLRWLRVRSTLGRWYRGADLAWAARHSQKLIAISNRTYQDLAEWRPGTESVVIHLGPGQIRRINVTDERPNDILLIGRASHKRNRLAAETIIAMPRDTFRNVITVNVDPAVSALLEQAIGPSRVELHANPSAEVLEAIYNRSRISMQLSVEEGFGLPYIEALAAGCVVVAIDQPLTRELLGDAAVLLRDGSSQELAKQMLETELPQAAVRAEVASRYSWDRFASQVADLIRRSQV